ncbi:MAG: hypothetical protein LBT97_02730 [Planctomycetota bacterium]|jgi:hypothetical protein|nr:hypothetical protein [Planctomycetota bacterium]
MAPEKALKKRDYIGIHFKCCNLYGRIYKNAAGNAYVGWCPRCARKVEVKVGKGGEGTDQRIFQAY